MMAKLCFLLVGLLLPLGQARADEPAAAAAGYDDGFVLRSADGARALRVGGWVQVLSTTEHDGDEFTTDEARVRRGRLSLTGQLSRTWRAKLLLDFIAANPLLDYYVDFTPSRAFTLRAGQLKMPMARQYLISASRKQFVDDGLTAATFRYGRDIGVMALGSLWGRALSYQLAVVNGEGSNRRAEDLRPGLAARVISEPLGRTPKGEADLSCARDLRVSLGLAASTRRVDFAPPVGDEVVKADQQTFGIEAALYWRGLSAAAEGFWRQEAPDEGDARASAGSYAQVGYMLIPSSLELAGRGAWVRRDTELDVDHVEGTCALSWYLSGHRLKLQADYTAADVMGGEEDQALAHRLRLQLQAAF
jgi:hypothetical protein